LPQLASCTSIGQRSIRSARRNHAARAVRAVLRVQDSNRLTIPLLGLANAGGFAATFFIPSVVRAEFHGGPAMSSTIIAAAYSLAIVVNPLCGWLADRLDRWLVMAAMSAVMIPACILMSSRNVYVFGLATALLVALGHAAANQVYPTAAGLLRGRDTGPIMGIVGLGSGIFATSDPRRWAGCVTIPVVLTWAGER